MARTLSGLEAESDDASRSGSGLNLSNLTGSDGYDDDDDDDDDVVRVPFEHLPDDVYGLTVCSLCRDVYFISRREGRITPRVARIVTSILKVVFTVFAQAYLLIEIKHYVTPSSVYEVRESYSVYERVMYDKTELNIHNHHRGISGFNASRFNDLTPDEREAACLIPLSRPYFFGVVLYIWTVCNLVDLKVTWGFAESLLLLATSCRYMSDALVPIKQSKDRRVFVVAGLPLWMKLLISVLVVLPRAAITMRVLWLGSRWLLATTPFGELVLNAVALEFVLYLNRVFFGAFASERSKIDLANTKVLCRRKRPSNLASFIGTTLFGLAALAWVALYIGIPGVHGGWQGCLPDYKWDLREVCAEWFETHFCVDPPCNAVPKSMWFYLLGFA